MTSGVHLYQATCRWAGSTALGYEEYGRDHELDLGGPALQLAMSADPAFGGNSELTNPEQLLLAAAVSCQMLSFLAVAARARINVVRYEDSAEARMPEEPRPVRITSIELRPHITIASTTGRVAISRLEHLVRIAHEECFIANSLRSEISLRPTFSFVPPGNGTEAEPSPAPLR